MKRKWLTTALAATYSIVVIIIILRLLWNMDVFVTDRSATTGSGGIMWNGRVYSNIGGTYSEGRTLAKGKKGSLKINEVEEDSTHTFIVARYFLDQFLCVANDYEIPKSGEITKVSWNGEYIQDKEFIRAMEEIDSVKTTTFDYETEEIYSHTDNQQMGQIYFAYEDCPVATENMCYLGKINDEWVVTTYISPDISNGEAPSESYTVGCYSIPAKYSKILEKYFLNN